MTHAFNAMMFARDVHKDQVRKYTGNPYADHLAEVAGIVAAASGNPWFIDDHIAIAWLHDCVEDCGVTVEQIAINFNSTIAEGVMLLSDMETGSRAERKAKSCARLAEAPAYVQSIKVADLISNTSSIVKHDPKFAVTYVREKAALLDAMTLADPRLVRIAREQIA